ncbi:putative receptor-like protein kinase At3g47110 [Rhododendron vialii]|uniref:putative receptor-like protein kinase At3g47110 n=1 Tax=Rhododendron vialii TaxID=182163 RepID=UPI00265E6F9D|nr:putative receptor-like protein kinase At3g47110 [Rhododendron vialii]
MALGWPHVTWSSRRFLSQISSPSQFVPPLGQLVLGWNSIEHGIYVARVKSPHLPNSYHHVANCWELVVEPNMKMSLETKAVSIHLVALFLSLIPPLLQIKALALDTTTSSLSLANNINVAGNETDFHALLAFKSNIYPEYQHALSSWNESLHFCRWQGVTCTYSCRLKRVTIIDLTSKGLTGSLTLYIGNLSFLQELRLSNNTFIGKIPTELGNPFRLQNLNLSFNGFEGTIPTSLSHCSNLMYLNVRRNKLVREFLKELAYSMPRLIYLIVSENNLTGGVPPSIGNLSSLTCFSAFDNPFRGSILNALGQLRNLNFLQLGETQISGTIPPSIYNLSLLVVFSVQYNRLQGSLPPTFGFMFPHLEDLQLYANQFNGLIPLSISNCSQLVRLELQMNRLSGKVSIDFGNMQNLRWIHLEGNNFETRGSDGLAFLSSFTNCSALRKLLLANNQFGGVLPDSVGNLSTSLYWLSLGGNQLYGSIPSTIGNLVNLQTLLLGNNLFTGSIPFSIGYLHKARRISFSQNTISGEIPKSIGNLSLLIELYLGKNKLEGAIPASLGYCRNLLLLRLYENNLNGSIPRQLLMRLENSIIY